jgi:hypothetical protein
MSIGGAFGVDRSDPNDRRLYDALASFGSGSSGLGTWGDLVGATQSRLMTLTQEIQPAYHGTLPSGDLAAQLTLCARLINANLGIRVLNTEFGSFDTHTDQAATHADLLSDFDAGLNAFFTTLDPAWASRVVVMTFSEFGRRPEADDGGGTDHGTANVMFVVGDRVKGGLYGQQPSLARSGLDQYGNLVHLVDFRSVYASIVSTWFGADEREVLGAAYPAVDLFRAGPGAASSTGGSGSSPSSGAGYWIATTTGAIASAGHAPHEASLGALARPVVGGDVTASQHGFWLVASDGGIFCFGDAGFHGAAAGAIPAPARVLRRSASGRGYWILAADGTVRVFGDAKNYGSARAPGAVALLPAHS